VRYPSARNPLTGHAAKARFQLAPSQLHVGILSVPSQSPVSPQSVSKSVYSQLLVNFKSVSCRFLAGLQSVPSQFPSQSPVSPGQFQVSILSVPSQSPVSPHSVSRSVSCQLPVNFKPVSCQSPVSPQSVSKSVSCQLPVNFKSVSCRFLVSL
jgi:hypothetical protein